MEEPKPVLNSIKLIYSGVNVPIKHRGRMTGMIKGPRRTPFELNPNEEINNITVHVGDRQIPNEFMNGGKTLLVVGIQFHTTSGRTSRVYGGSGEAKIEPDLPGYVLGYVKGMCAGYIDSLQFVWYKRSS
jgi:hypothetical protein